jgi:hypothetical protein
MFAQLGLRFGRGLKIVPRNGEKNTLFGVYGNECCHFEIVISVGTEFPACPKHPDRITEWTPIEIDIAHVVSLKKKNHCEPAA